MSMSKDTIMSKYEIIHIHKEMSDSPEDVFNYLFTVSTVESVKS